MAQAALEISYSDEALRTLRRSNKRKLIGQKIEELAANPDMMRANVTRLQGRSDSRLRVQDWRVIFRIEHGTLWIDKVLPRGTVYEADT